MKISLYALPLKRVRIIKTSYLVPLLTWTSKKPFSSNLARAWQSPSNHPEYTTKLPIVMS